MTPSAFLAGLAVIHFADDAYMARQCRDYATIALNNEAECDEARRERRRERARELRGEAGYRAVARTLNSAIDGNKPR